MSTENPFSDRHPYGQPPSEPRPQVSAGGGWLIILVVFAGAGLVFCGGLATVAYFALHRAAGISSDIPLPQRGDTRAADQALFNQSLANPLTDPRIDPDVCEFVELALQALRQGNEFPFSPEMFIEAVAASEQSQGSLGIIDRFSIRTWLTEYEPTPGGVEENARIVGVHLDETGTFATVDLLLYSSDNQVVSQQWYLVKEEQVWKMYDWQRMEYGRRMSDEYAGYVLGKPPRADGYDIAMERLVEAQELWWDGHEEEARKKLLACERIPMLDGDRPVARLRTAYTWMSVDQYDETIRVLQSIEEPDDIWGVWPVLAVCYVSEGDYEKALEAALKAQKQSPNHPNVHSLLATIYEALDRDDESADAALAALRICHDDSGLFSDVVSRGRTKDIPALLDVLMAGDNGEYGWPRIFSQAAGSTEWAQALLDQVSARVDLPDGVMEIAAGNLAWSQQDYDTAATHFLKAGAAANLPYLKMMATRDHLSARIEQKRFRQLLAETEDLDATLSTLVAWAFDDQLDCDSEILLAALEQSPDAEASMWASGLGGWAYHGLRRNEEALPRFTKFLDWLETDDARLNEDQQWISATTEYFVAQCMLELDRPLDLLGRWPEDVDRHDQLGDHLLQAKNASIATAFLAATDDTENDSVRLQRLRLQSAAAMRDGDAEECDRYHRAAIELGREVYGEERSNLLLGLVRQRARDLVWNRVDEVDLGPDDADDSGTSLRDQLFTSAVAETVVLGDSEALAAWLNRAEEAGIRRGQTYAALQQSLGEHRLSRGEHMGAIKPLRDSLNEEQDGGDWLYDRRRLSLIRAMVKAKRLVDLRNWLTQDASDERDERDIPPEAIVSLAAGDAESLKEAMGGIDKEEVLRWLSDSPQREWLQLHADKSWVRELIMEHPLPLRFQRPQASGELLLSRDAAIDSLRIEQLLGDVLGESFELQPVAGEQATPNAAAYLASFSNGQRVAVGWSIQAYETDALPAALAGRLDQPVGRLTIEILDDDPHATKRLFDLAAAAADADAIVFSWDEEMRLWFGPDLKQQLQWQDRVPVNPEVIENPLIVKNESADDELETDDLGIDQWAALWAEAGKSALSIQVTQSTRRCSELIPCELEGVDVENDRLQIRPTADSKIDPLVKAGVAYTCGPGMARKPMRQDAEGE